MLIKKEDNITPIKLGKVDSQSIHITKPIPNPTLNSISNHRLAPKKKLLYPFILYCCNYTDDDFWRNVFEDLAYGKSPFGTYIYKNTIISTSKGKEFTFVITEDKTPQENYNNIYSLFSKKLGIISIKEKLANNGGLQRIMKYDEWSNIRKKNIRDILLEQFILSKKKEYHLSMNTCRKFMSVICFALLCKTILSKHIEMYDGKIESIKGVKFFNRNIEGSDEESNGDIATGNDNGDTSSRSINGDITTGNNGDTSSRSIDKDITTCDDESSFGSIIYDYNILENYKYVNESKSMISRKNIFNNWNLFIDKYYKTSSDKQDESSD